MKLCGKTAAWTPNQSSRQKREKTDPYMRGNLLRKLLRMGRNIFHYLLNHICSYKYKSCTGTSDHVCRQL